MNPSTPRLFALLAIVLVVAASPGAAALAQDDAPAQAPAPGYTYIEGGLLRLDPDSGSSDTGGFIGGSLGLGNFQIYAEYGDSGSTEIWFVGGGWHGLLGRRADLVAQAAFVDSDFADGFRIEVGIRVMIVQRFEFAGFLTHTDLDLSDTNAFTVRGIWDFTKRMGVGGSFEFSDDGNTSRAFVRFNFGKK